MTDNLLGNRNKLSVVGYEKSLSMRCIEARRLLQFEIVGAAAADSSRASVLSAQPIECRGTGIGAILVGSSWPLDAREQESLAALSDALAGVLESMVLSKSMSQLLAWREQDMSFCGPPLELQDVPCFPMAPSLRPLADRIPPDEHSEQGEGGSGGEAEAAVEETPQHGKTVPYEASAKLRGTFEEGEKATSQELPDGLIIRMFGLSWLYLSAVIAGKMFAQDGLALAPAIVAVLALVSGLGSLFVLYPRMRNGVSDSTSTGIKKIERTTKLTKLTAATATVVAATNAALSGCRDATLP